MSLLKNINLSNKRMENESFEDYKKRRKENKKRIKWHLKGEMIWESKIDGTYTKKI